MREEARKTAAERERANPEVISPSHATFNIEGCFLTFSTTSGGGVLNLKVTCFEPADMLMASSYMATYIVGLITQSITICEMPRLLYSKFKLMIVDSAKRDKLTNK